MGEALLVGALLSGVAGLKSSHDQRKAARAASRAAEAAANKPATVSTSTAAAATTNTEGNAEQAVQQKAKRRFTLDDTVNRYASSGLRKTLG